MAIKKIPMDSCRTAIKHSKAVTRLINNASKLKRSKTVIKSFVRLSIYEFDSYNTKYYESEKNSG